MDVAENMSEQAIRVGIFGSTDAWQQSLLTVGVPFDEITKLPDSQEKYSVIILNAPPSEKVRNWLDTFIKSGNTIIETGKASCYFSRSVAVRRKFIRFSTPIPGAEHISDLSLSGTHYTVPEALYAGGLVHLPADPEDRLMFFGLNPDDLLTELGHKRKRFPGINGFEPDELVSITDKGAFFSILEAVLRDAHLRRGLPFVQKWHSPEERPYFAFRVDSDYGDRTSITNLSTLAKRHQIPVTWFLHVEAHEEWLDLFRDFSGDELALHGYEHATTRSVSTWTQNIRKGLDILHQNGISPTGFCAPYGILNEGLRKALTEFEFDYTSEFSAGFDALPFRLSDRDPLQIPIHPVCTGSLSRLGATESDMTAYFMAVLRERHHRFEPLIFYHHPLQPGSQVWDVIFDEIRKLGWEPTTFQEIAGYWLHRQNAALSVIITDDRLMHIELDEPVLSRIWTDHHHFSLSKGASTIDLSELKPTHELPTSFSSASVRSEPDIASKLSLLKTSLIDWRNRKRI